MIMTLIQRRGTQGTVHFDTVQLYGVFLQFVIGLSFETWIYSEHYET